MPWMQANKQTKLKESIFIEKNIQQIGTIVKIPDYSNTEWQIYSAIEQGAIVHYI